MGVVSVGVGDSAGDCSFQGINWSGVGRVGQEIVEGSNELINQALRSTRSNLNDDADSLQGLACLVGDRAESGGAIGIVIARRAIGC